MAHISPTINKLHPNPPTKNSFLKCWQKVFELIFTRPHGVVPCSARVQDSNPSTKKYFLNLTTKFLDLNCTQPHGHAR
jgi:hypothetical protein